MKNFELPVIQIIKFECEVVTSSTCSCNEPYCISYCKVQQTCPGKCIPNT